MPTNEEVAGEIERQVAAAHSDMDLRRFARFYTRQTGEKVAGMYVYSSEGHTPIVGTPGTSTWVARETDMPVIHDGGCSVLRVAYDAGERKLMSVECDISEADVEVPPDEKFRGVRSSNP